MHRILLAAGACLLAFNVTANVPHINWENHPVHALDLSPSGDLLAVAHTADHRVQFFDLSTGMPVAVGHVPVGLDPVSVRFRTDEELWVVNHLSDSISVVDVPKRAVRATVHTADEPFDVVFAGNPQRAFVSCSQANRVQVFDPAALSAPQAEIAIAAEDPRAMAVSPDGNYVYVAIFESGNGSTVLAGATEFGDDPPNVTRLPGTPHGGVNPPPNAGVGFSPPVDGNLPDPPKTALIVRKDDQGRWMDDNNGDWTEWVSGASAAESGRVAGWDLPDRDVAIIRTSDLAVTYATGLMNIGMAIATHPATGEATLVGTDAENQVRFEPNVNGRFLRVELASVSNPAAPTGTVHDLNPHLDYQQPTIAQAQRDLSLGDPRGIAWREDGSRGYVTGMGSNTVIAVGADGARMQGMAPIEVGQGPTGVVVDDARGRAYVWNHFDVSLSVLDIGAHAEVARIPVFSPLPASIVEGRPHFYGTHETSGLGHIACASCHVDGKMDRLAWDLGDPSGEVKQFNQNCSTSLVVACLNFHPMKGPMTTQTLQDIIGHEPHHWRGDRDGLEEFNGAFMSLQGDDEMLTAQEMQQFEDFLDTLYLPPNPFRNLDNSLSTQVSLDGHVNKDGVPLPTGNAHAGLGLFVSAPLDLAPLQAGANSATTCHSCHSLPTGMAPNSPAFDDGLQIGGNTFPPGPNGENHLGIVGGGTVTTATMKVPQLRNLYDKVGYLTTASQSPSGFGFLHDGSIDSLARLVDVEEFGTANDQEVADLVAFLLSFAGSDLPIENSSFSGQLLDTQDMHAAVGQQEIISGGASTARLDTLVALASSGAVGLVAHQAETRRSRGWAYDRGSNLFLPDDDGVGQTAAQVAALGDGSSPVTFTVVPAGLADRLGRDRDSDGMGDGAEIAQWSDPADASSTQFTPRPGHWYPPERSGHGIDLQRAGNKMVATWYSYNEDGSPHWYQANGDLVGTSWTGDLYETKWDHSNSTFELTVVGTLTMNFSDAEHADFAWQIGNESGTEAFEFLNFDSRFTPGDYTGHWWNPAESGWGVTLASLGENRVTLVFYYDANGDPAWVLGVGDNASGTTYDMMSFEGFCPWCATVEVTELEGGTLRMDFDGNRAATIDMAVDYPPIAGGVFAREVPLVPLSNEVIDPRNR